MIDPGLADRVALVTGGNCGIGEAIARALADQGAAVAVGYLRMAPDAHAAGLPARYASDRARSGEEVADAIRSAGGRATAIETDLSEAARIGELFDRAETALGPVDILVLNASSWLADSFVPELGDRFERGSERVSGGSHDHQFAVDARAAAVLIAEYAARHRSRGADWGRIVAMTSSGRHGFPGEVSYGAAKAALESYVKSAALELGSRGVTANLIHPPTTDTGWVTEAVARSAREASPLGHVGEPRDVAEVVVFLASEQARFVTGNVVQMH